jgi:hypothetical protein
MIRLAGGVPGPIRAFPLSVFYLLYCICILHYHIVQRKDQYRGAELPYRHLSYNTIDRGSKAVPLVDAEVLRLNGPVYMFFEQLLFCIYSSTIMFQAT